MTDMLNMEGGMKSEFMVFFLEGNFVGIFVGNIVIDLEVRCRSGNVKIKFSNDPDDALNLDERNSLW